jgi:gliding motility-associated-like protein
LNFTFNAVTGIGTGTWTKTTGPGTATFVPDIHSPTATVTVSEYGTYTFTWTVVNGTCSNSSIVIVNFYEQPVAKPGPGGIECDLDFALNAEPGPGIGTWTKTSGPGSATFAPSANSPAGTVTVSLPGTYSFKWTLVNNTCSSSASVTVTFTLQPSANAGVGGNNCGPSYTLNAVPSVGTGIWTKSSGPGTLSFNPNANSPGAKVTVSAYGQYTFKWKEVNGTCADSDLVNVNFLQIPVANAGSDGLACGLDYVLNAIPAVGAGTGTWTKVNGPGNAIFSPDPNLPGAKVTVDQYGTYDFSWTEVNGTCLSTDLVQVVFHSLPALSAGNDTIICKGNTCQLKGEGTGTFLWAPATLLNNPNVKNPVASPVESTSFSVILTDTYGCINYDTVLVTVRNNPVANAGPDQVLKYSFGTTLEAVEPGLYETGNWSTISGSAEFADPSYARTTVSGLSLNENILCWTVTNRICPDSRDSVKITVNDLLVPTLITPNMDGKNDYFVLIGLETLGKTQLIIFDRRGMQVYKNTDYDNSWNGVDDHGKPLLDDTYFYVLRSENGKSLSGYIVIRR